MKRYFIMIAIALSLLALACKKEDPVYPSMAGSIWDVFVKWSHQSDTVMFYPRFDAGGTGVEVDAMGTPTSVTFTWSQNNGTVTWSYPSTIHFTGSLSQDGKTMTGTGSYTSFPTSAGFRAVKE